ncbi:hypothetical protein [Streptomyces chrestomyceticus]
MSRAADGPHPFTPARSTGLAAPVAACQITHRHGPGPGRCP